MIAKAFFRNVKANQLAIQEVAFVSDEIVKVNIAQLCVTVSQNIRFSFNAFLLTGRSVFTACVPVERSTRPGIERRSIPNVRWFTAGAGTRIVALIQVNRPTRLTRE